ncbi:MAG: ATP-binding protein [Bacteroidota bacterium]
MEEITGRKNELKLIKRIEKSGQPELVAVYGRRRVGKTFLIRNGFKQGISFEFTGSSNASLSQELESFSLALSKAAGGLPLATPGTWVQAFHMLSQFLTPLLKRERVVIFIDEFPWLDTPRSAFLSAFGQFWNSWASKEKKLVVVICGSAAAWMIKKVLNNRGGLHNRVTRRIRLLPFTVSETAEYLKLNKVKLDKYQVLQIYMAMGGIPQYLKEIEPGDSAMQAIDKICFTNEGLLHDEFKKLYTSLFDSAENHIDIIRALAKKGKGLTRTEIIQTCNLTSGGYATQLLDELKESGFITPYIPFGKTVKDSLYKLTDEYSLFYIRFIENTRAKGEGAWQMFSASSTWKSWSGIAYESICIKHIDQIKAGLGIKSVYTEVSSWRYIPKSADEQGTQVDLVIDRADGCINLCEIKFATDAFEITKAYAKELENKIRVFKSQTKTRKSVFMTLMTTYGVKDNNYAGLIQSEVNMDVLF